MRDTKQEDRDFEQIMAMVKELTPKSVDDAQDRHNKMRDGVWAMLVICIPILTISTILWQWLG
jgi:hypothetical protein